MLAYRKDTHEFKKANNLLPADPTPAQKYEMDQAALDRLDRLAPIVPLG